MTERIKYTMYYVNVVMVSSKHLLLNGILAYFVELMVLLKGAVVEWLERLKSGAERRRMVVRSRLGFAM